MNIKNAERISGELIFHYQRSIVIIGRQRKDGWRSIAVYECTGNASFSSAASLKDCIREGKKYASEKRSRRELRSSIRNTIKQLLDQTA